MPAEGEAADVDRLIPRDEARRMLGGISERSLHNYRKRGLLDGVPVGNRLLYRLSDLQRLVRTGVPAPTAAAGGGGPDAR